MPCPTQTLSPNGKNNDIVRYKGAIILFRKQKVCGGRGGGGGAGGVLTAGQRRTMCILPR